MSILEKPSSSSSIAARDIDPLLKDLNEKKQSFRRHVVSLAAELKEVRSRLASQEQSYAQETLTRQEAELKAKSMEVQIGILRKKLEERDVQLQASASSAMEYLKELDNLRSQLSVTRASADASATLDQSAQLQCLQLLKEIDEKNTSLRENEGRVIRLVEQLDSLWKDHLASESSQKQLEDDVLKIEHDIMQALAHVRENKDCVLRKILAEVSPMNFDKVLNKLLVVKDEEIAKLKDEIKIMSSNWKLMTGELESQLEKHHHTEQELKKRVLKLELCLREARSQTRKLQRMGEQQELVIKELREQLAAKQQRGAVIAERQNEFWETYGFKIALSLSMIMLVVLSKR